MYSERMYRNFIGSTDLVNFGVIEKETDLLISADKDLTDTARTAIIENRRILEGFIQDNPDFLTTLKPYKLKGRLPALIQEMVETSALAGVGPMATVAGVLAQKVGESLYPFSSQVLVENGGDIFMRITRKRKVRIYTVNTYFADKLALEICPEDSPLGICTSSGTLGHSLSFGRADAAVVLSSRAALADAAATAIGNRVKAVKDISRALNWGKSIPGITGILVMKDKKIAVWGKINLANC